MRIKPWHFTDWLELVIMKQFPFSCCLFNCHIYHSNCLKFCQIFLLEYTMKLCRPHWMKLRFVFVNLRRRFPDTVQMHEQPSNCHRIFKWFLQFHVWSLFNFHQNFPMSLFVEKLFKILILVMLSIELSLQPTKPPLTMSHEHCFSYHSLNIAFFIFYELNISCQIDV